MERPLSHTHVCVCACVCEGGRGLTGFWAMCVLGSMSFRRGCSSLDIYHLRLSSCADADQRAVYLIRQGHEVLPGGINKLGESSSLRSRLTRACQTNLTMKWKTNTNRGTVTLSPAGLPSNVLWSRLRKNKNSGFILFIVLEISNFNHEPRTALQQE